jgi:hypothetical protein
MLSWRRYTVLIWKFGYKSTAEGVIHRYPRWLVKGEKILILCDRHWVADFG